MPNFVKWKIKGINPNKKTFRMKMNYVLELTEPARHPIYISTVVFCTTPVIFLSPLAGALISKVGYAIPFILVSAAAITAWTMTFFIVEPRSAAFSTSSDQSEPLNTI